MNSKITLATLAQLVAQKGGHDPRICENVLRQMFRYISATLEGGENVKIKGFGTFKISDVASRKSVDVTSGLENTIPAHRKIMFIPGKELAAAVNAPFEMFETVVVEENILEEELMQAEAEGNEILADSIRQEIILEEEKMDELKDTYPVEFSSESQNIPEESEETPEEASNETPDSSDNTTESSINNLGATEHSTEEETATKEPSTADEDIKSAGEDIKSADEDIKSKEESQSQQGKRQPTEIKVGKSHFWLWTIISGFAACLIGVALLWWLNDDFGNWGRSIFNPDRKVISADSLLDPEVATIISNDENLAEENTDMTGLVEEEQPDTELDKSNDNNTKTGDKKIEEKSSGHDVVPTKPSDAAKPVYDEVTDTRYLSTIAREHYGNYHLWPYIYKENEKILGHPNRIRPGTRVVVPPLSKYGVDAKNPDDIKQAKKLATEIYQRYQ